MSFMGHCDFEKGSQSQYFQSILFGREGGRHKKEYSVHALDNFETNSGRPDSVNVCSNFIISLSM